MCTKCFVFWYFPKYFQGYPTLYFYRKMLLDWPHCSPRPKGSACIKALIPWLRKVGWIGRGAWPFRFDQELHALCMPFLPSIVSNILKDTLRWCIPIFLVGVWCWYFESSWRCQWQKMSQKKKKNLEENKA